MISLLWKGRNQNEKIGPPLQIKTTKQINDWNYLKIFLFHWRNGTIFLFGNKCTFERRKIKNVFQRGRDRESWEVGHVNFLVFL